MGFMIEKATNEMLKSLSLVQKFSFCHNFIKFP